MAKQITLRQKKLKLLEKVMAAGLVKEADITAMTPADMVKLPDITTEELRLLCDMQDSVRSGSFYSFLCAE